MVEAAAQANAFTDIFLTKLDVLTGWEQIPVCVGYDVNGARHDSMPVTQSDFHHAVPIYEELDGWTEDITGCRYFDDLPKNTQAYVNGSRSCAAPGSPASASAPPASSRSSSTTCSDCGASSCTIRLLADRAGSSKTALGREGLREPGSRGSGPDCRRKALSIRRRC